MNMSASFYELRNENKNRLTITTCRTLNGIEEEASELLSISLVEVVRELEPLEVVEEDSAFVVEDNGECGVDGGSKLVVIIGVCMMQ